MYKHLKTLAFLNISFQIFIGKKIATTQHDIKHQPKTTEGWFEKLKSNISDNKDLETHTFKDLFCSTWRIISLLVWI